MKVRTWVFAAAAIAVALVSGCGDHLCLRGETQPCACVGGVSGARTCSAEGSFGACVCALAGTFVPADAAASAPKRQDASQTAVQDASVDLAPGGADASIDLSVAPDGAEDAP